MPIALLNILFPSRVLDNWLLLFGSKWLFPSDSKCKFNQVVLCQEKVQIKCNQFSLFLAKFNLQSLLHSFRAFRDIVPRIQLETNIHNLCQEKVQIKCNQFSLFLAKFNLQSLLHSFRAFRDIVPRIQLETNIHNNCECVLYCKMFRCIQKSIYMHACS